MKVQVQKLIELLDQTFNKNAWHGPSVLEALDGVSAEQVARRIPHTHNIIELVAHMTSWRVYVVRKLEGDAAYKVPDDQNFPAATDWHATIEGLKKSQQQLIEGLQRITDEKLDEIVPGTKSRLTFYTLLHAIIHHDLYHTGQISLIKKATGQQTI